MSCLSLSSLLVQGVDLGGTWQSQPQGGGVEGHFLARLVADHLEGAQWESPRPGLQREREVPRVQCR